MGGCGGFGLGLGVGTVCGRELFKGLVCVVYVRRRVFVGGDFFWRKPLLLEYLFIVTSSCLRFLG